MEPLTVRMFEDAFQPRSAVNGASLIKMMGMSQEEFSRRFKGSAVKRTRRREC